MLGWRKRNDGFEWRDYVRTTILVRRKHRRDRVGEARKAAVENLKAAGHRGAMAGAEGAKVVGRGAANVGHQGAVLGAAGAKAMGRGALHYGQQGAQLGVAGVKGVGARLRTGLPMAGEYLRRFGAGLLAAIAYIWAVLTTLTGVCADHLSPALAPIGRTLRQPSIRLPLIIVGGVSLAGGVIRAYVNGFETDTVIALGIGVAILGPLALAHVSVGPPSWMSEPFASASNWLRAATAGASGRPFVQTGAAVLVLALIVGGAYAAFRSPTDDMPTSRRAARQAAVQAVPSGDVEGRGTAVSGDSLRVGSTLIRLDGIEAPEPDQMCKGADGAEWSCGRMARQALAGLLRTGRVYCDVSITPDGPSNGDCKVGDQDIGAALVRGGYVFANSGLFAPYTGLEEEARGNRAGLWAGQVVRPSDYRAQKWEEAKRDAPDGCPIKGSVRGSRRYYVVPWARGYERIRISLSRGERWFCSEAEAQEAGFRPVDQS